MSELITFVRMCFNLELSLIEEFVVYETTVKIFTILKIPCAKGCYLMQRLEPVIGKFYLPQCFGNKFLLP